MILARTSHAVGQLQWKKAKDMEEKVTGIMGTQILQHPAMSLPPEKGASALRRQMGMKLS